jgi:hypothetical protein
MCLGAMKNCGINTEVSQKTVVVSKYLKNQLQTSFFWNGESKKKKDTHAP